jgi:hypothetical protein
MIPYHKNFHKTPLQNYLTDLEGLLVLLGLLTPMVLLTLMGLVNPTDLLGLLDLEDPEILLE